MGVYDAQDFDNHEQVVFISEASLGLRAIIAVHNTNLGPALGGCRMWPYPAEADALADVLRLSRGMTYKAAMAGVNLGGGKAVVIADSQKDKRPELLHAIGRWIDSLGGRYITGEDIGTNPFDMAEIKRETRYVSCLRKEDGGYGDPAPMTALGVFQAISAGAERVFGAHSLSGLHVAVQGIGNVGRNLCRLLFDAGAKLTVCDVLDENLRDVASQWDAQIVPPEAIYDLAADVFAPCAFGSVLNDDTIQRLNMRIVAGAANNQLETSRHGEALKEKGIVYLPDYVANGGGLICCSAEWYRHDPEQVVAHVKKIRDTCLEILDRASERNVATNIASDELAEKRFLRE